MLNLSGQVVAGGNFCQSISIATDALKRGLYIIKVDFDKTVYSGKIIVR